MTDDSDLKLDDGSRIAVIGGGPAGSFFSYFLLAMTERMGLDVHVDIYESRDFANSGPTGCNMCGGIISESLVQALAAEGIDLPPTVVQRGIDSYFLHMDVGSVQIETILNEAGSSKNKVLQVRIFISNSKLWDKVNDRYSFFFEEHKPVRCVIPTRELHFGCLIEIETMAILND